MTSSIDWDETTLGDIGETLIGLTYSPSQIGIEGTLVLRSSNIQNGALDLRDTVRVTADIPAKIRIKRSDILICARNGSRALIGKSLLLDRRVEGETFGAFMAVFRSPLNEYLSFFFQSNAFKRQVDEHLGATINQITNRSLKSFSVLIPPSADRARITTALADVSDLIQQLESLIVKKQAIRQGMMQQLLTGKTRLPGFSDEWQSKKLSDLLTYEQPGRYLVSNNDYVRTGVPVLTAGKTFVLGYTTETDGIYEAWPVVIFDDFTTASKYVSFPFKAKSSAMKMLSARPDADLRFVFERMQQIDFVAVDHKRRWITEFSKLEIATPPIEEQHAIASVAEDADDEIDALERRVSSVRAIKQGMMQELLTGRTRLTSAGPAA